MYVRKSKLKACSLARARTRTHPAARPPFSLQVSGSAAAPSLSDEHCVGRERPAG